MCKEGVRKEKKFQEGKLIVQRPSGRGSGLSEGCNFSSRP